ncbi:hypothetical protein SLS57_010876 [Botryosphaeria dothidea]
MPSDATTAAALPAPESLAALAKGKPGAVSPPSVPKIIAPAKPKAGTPSKHKGKASPKPKLSSSSKPAAVATTQSSTSLRSSSATAISATSTGDGLFPTPFGGLFPTPGFGLGLFPTPSVDLFIRAPAEDASKNSFIPEAVAAAVPPRTPEQGSLDGPENLRIRLVVPAPATPERPALVDRTIHLNGQEWYLTEMFRTPKNAATFPNYTAISYRWYDGRLPNPFFDGYLMSNLTLPSLESAMRNSPQEAFWIDCFSIPAEKPLKGIILDLLSNIFSAAHEVIVPLGLNSRKTLPLLAGKSDLATTPLPDLESALQDLNQEAWVQSIWTYKEALSSKQYIFTDRSWKKTNSATGTSEPQLTDLKFFKRISEALHSYTSAKKWTAYDVRANLSNVDALEDLGLDRQQNEESYTRSVFESLASLDRRYVESDKNFFWGLYGVITEDQIPANKPHSTLSELYERFFEVCEGKNDYSFVYTMAERQTVAGKGVYPKPGPIHSLLSWATDANYQTGTRTPKGIKLDGMVTLQPATALGQRGKKFIQSWFASGVPAITDDGSDGSIARKVLQILRMIDYSGSEEFVLTGDGVFFPQRPVGPKDTILVASQLGWAFGSPGFAKVQDAAGATYVPGVFVGHVAKDKVAAVLMS